MRALTRPGDRIGLAVSGGPDSLALLLLAHAVVPAAIEAATVDHGLRPESGAEADFVASICHDLGVRHRTLPVLVGKGSLQAAAREARYAALAQWAGERGLSCIATAHHADDQAETFLMRLNRGSGVAGLAGIREKGPVREGAIPLVRPLLGWRRAELGRLVVDAGIEAVQDPSNLDPRFDRVRLRQELQVCDWLDVAAIAESARHLADADEALNWVAERVLAESVRWEEGGALLPMPLPRVLAMRVMAAIIGRLSGGVARGSALARSCDALSEGRPATLAGVLVKPQAQGWRFTREGERSHPA